MSLLRRSAVAAASLVAAVLAYAPPASANERHFTYTYESNVLPAGARELEIWNTWRGVRRSYYSAFDHRLEYEVGLTSRLQTAFYLNFGGVTEDNTSRFEYRGISSEWKYKLLDQVADPIGLALYGELEASTDFMNVEAKVILDKRIGHFLIASNLIVEPEWVFTKPTEQAVEVEATAAVSYFVRPDVGVGIEGFSQTELEGDELEVEHSAIYAGPVVSYAHDAWWVSAAALRQLPAPAPDAVGGRYVLGAGEKYNVRLLFSFHL